MVTARHSHRHHHHPGPAGPAEVRA